MIEAYNANKSNQTKEKNRCSWRQKAYTEKILFEIDVLPNPYPFLNLFALFWAAAYFCQTYALKMT